MARMRYVVDSGSHRAGDVVEVSKDGQLELLRAGLAVLDVPKVERLVKPQPNKRTAVVQR